MVILTGALWSCLSSSLNFLCSLIPVSTRIMVYDIGENIGALYYADNIRQSLVFKIGNKLSVNLSLMVNKFC